MSDTKSGFIWSLIERFSSQGIQFILSLVIARLLRPADFGLIAMTSIFMALAQVFIDSGFGSALIQKKDRSNIDFSTVFYFNIAVAIVIYTLLFYAAPLISDFYHLTDLTTIIRILGLNLIISSFSIVQRSKLNILLNFKSLAKVSLISVFVGGSIGVVLAIYDYGVWALVYQTLITSLLTTILLWTVTHWHPSLAFSKDSFRQLFSFGSRLLISDLIHTFYINLYSLVIGKKYNATDTGLYNRASTIAQYPILNLVQVMVRVVYPIQCEHQDDKNWIENTFPIILRMYVYITFPIALMICLFAKQFVSIVLSDKWIECAPLISILCFGYMMIPISNLNGNVIKALGRSDLTLKSEIIKKVVAIIILFGSLPFGLKPLCWGVVVYNLFDVLLIISYTRRILNINLQTQFKAILPIIILSLTTSAITIGFTFFIYQDAIKLFIGIGCFLLTYFGISKLFKYPEFSYIISLIKNSDA